MRINIQPIEKADHHEDGSLLVHSVFYTIQGEGPLTGHPAIFVRLSGCNLQCPKCDTDYTGGERMSPEALYKRIEALHPGPRLVVITGGEPFRQHISPLCWALIDADYQVQVETNGTLPPPEGFPGDAWVVVSPKSGKVHPDTEAIAVAYKYVLSADSVSPEDGLPLRALDHTAPRAGVARPPERLPVGAIYLQPCDEPFALKFDREFANVRNLNAVKRSCLRHGYTLQLQLHKILGMN